MAWFAAHGCGAWSLMAPGSHNVVAPAISVDSYFWFQPKSILRKDFDKVNLCQVSIS